MSIGELFILSVALGTDLFSLAVPIGMNRVRLRYILRAAMVFAAFHIGMILTGYFAGHSLGLLVTHVGAAHLAFPAESVANWASLIGAVVLGVLGLHMVWDNVRGRDETAVCEAANPLRGFTLLLLATSVTIDALAAGFSLGMLDVNLLILSLILGTVIFAIAILGLGLGRRLGRFIGRRSELWGGLVLIALAGHVLMTVVR